jgi:hypothetical protein
MSAGTPFAFKYKAQSCDKLGNSPTRTLASGHKICLAKTVFILETSAEVSTFLASLSEASL